MYPPGIAFYITLALERRRVTMDWKVVLIITAGAALLLAVLFRYEVVGVAAGGEGIHGIAYRLDRWTGEVDWMAGSNSGRVGKN
jgi:hypothetical protein